MIAYFDNASTTFRKPRVVYKAIRTYKKYGVNLSRGNNQNKCRQIVEETRHNIKRLVGVADNYEVAFSQSATYSINQIVKGLDSVKTIYISKFEHNAVQRVVENLAREKEIKVRFLEYKSYELDPSATAIQFQREKPDVVIICHLSNVCGLVQNYEPIFKEAKKYKAITILDMAQSFGLIETNLQKSNVDVAIFAGHKTFYGFAGIGGAIIKKSIKIIDIIQGGTGIDSANEMMPKELPAKLEPGTQNLLGIFSLFHSTKYLLKLGNKRINEIEKKNYSKLKAIIDKSEILKPIEIGHGMTIIACKPTKYQPDNYENYFNRKKISVRIVLQCSPTAHKTLGTFPSGTIRFSVGLFTKNSEFRRLLKAIKQLNKEF